MGDDAIYLDDLILNTILDALTDVSSLSNAAAVCKAFNKVAHEVASDNLLTLLKVRAESNATSRHREAPFYLAHHVWVVHVCTSVCCHSANACFPCIIVPRAVGQCWSNSACGQRSRRARC